MYQISSHNCGYFRFLTFRAWFSTAAAEREFRTLTVACLFVCLFLSVLAASTDTRTEHTRTRSINVSFLIFFLLVCRFPSGFFRIRYNPCVCICFCFFRCSRFLVSSRIFEFFFLLVIKFCSRSFCSLSCFRSVDLPCFSGGDDGGGGMSRFLSRSSSGSIGWIARFSSWRTGKSCLLFKNWVCKIVDSSSHANLFFGSLASNLSSVSESASVGSPIEQGVLYKLMEFPPFYLVVVAATARKVQKLLEWCNSAK